MFDVRFGEDKIDIPSNLSRTDEIFDKFSSINNFNKEELIMVYNEVNISPFSEFPLADIGFSPNDTLIITFNSKKKGYFKILPYNFVIDREINMCTNVFDIKKEFAKYFFTVPQNIIIKLKDTKLRDDILLFNEVKTPDPILQFDVEVEEGYALYYTYYGQFRYICMSDESTLEDLQNTIFSYYRLESIKREYTYFLPKLPAENLKKPLKELSKNTQLFEFTVEYSTNQVYPCNLIIKDSKESISYNASFPDKINIYSMTCILEQALSIDRKYFIAFDENNELIEKDIIVGPNSQIKITFFVTESLRVKINGKEKEFSYFSRIQNIKDEYHFEEHNFGIVINNQFACLNDKDDNGFLTQYLTNSLIDIKIMNSKVSCHTLTFSKISENGTQKSSYFLVPDDMKKDHFDQVVNKYLLTNLESIEITGDKNGIITYKSAKSRIVNFNFKDEKFNQYPYHFPLNKEEPRVLDLLTISFKYRTYPLSYKNLKYQALFNGKPLYFNQKLSSIQYNESNAISVIETKGSHEDEVKLKVLPENKIITLNITPDVTIEEIQKKYNLQDHSLFIDFQPVEGHDKPYICIKKDSIFIANKYKKESTFRVSNGSLEINCSLQSSDYNYLPSCIKLLFGAVSNNDIKFTLKSDDGDHILPPDFDAGSLPNNSLIIIDYSYSSTNQILIKKITDKLVLIDKYYRPISENKSIIMKSLNFYDYSNKAMCLSFYETKLLSEKSFNDYKITKNMPLSIELSNNSITINVSTPNQVTNEQYHFCINETIRDLKNHIKEQFRIKNNVIILQPNGSSIDDTVHLQDKMQLQVVTEQVTVKCKINQKEEEYIVDKIDRVDKVSEFINRHEIRTSQQLIYLFTYNKDEDCYEIVDSTKRILEFNCELFAHKILSNFNFLKYPIHYSKNNLISEQNSLKWFKKIFIAKQIINIPDNFVITRSEQEVDESLPMKNVYRGIHLEITFKDPNAEKKKKNKVRPPRINWSKYKPRVRNASEQNKKSESESEEEEKTSKGKTRKESERGGGEEKASKGKTRRESESEEEEEKTSKGKTIRESESEEEEEKTSKGKTIRESESEEEEEEKTSKGKTKRESERGETQSESKKIDDIIEEEEEDLSDTTDENDDIVCKFQIGRNTPFTLTMKNTDTIEDAKIKISQREGGIELNCISIVFAGKKLKKNLSIKSMKLLPNDILQVFIFTPQTILLISARNISSHGGHDFEYDSEDEEEDLNF